VLDSRQKAEASAHAWGVAIANVDAFRRAGLSQVVAPRHLCHGRATMVRATATRA
jgi:hypothetical protein